MNTKLRVGIVGSGIGRSHILAYQVLPDHFEVNVLCDIDEVRAHDVAASHAVPQAITDFDTLRAR
jgi:predicted dehydrogenase